MRKMFMGVEEVRAIIAANENDPLVGILIGYALPAICSSGKLNGILGYVVGKTEIGKTTEGQTMYELDIAYPIESTGYFTIQERVKFRQIVGSAVTNTNAEAWVCDPIDHEVIIKIVNSVGFTEHQESLAIH